MTIQSIFRGRQGFRAGWRFLLFCGLLFAFQAAANLALDFAVTRSQVTVPPWPNALVFIVQDSVTLLAALAATLIMARLERRKLADYYIPGRDSFGREFWIGCGFGCAGVSARSFLVFAAKVSAKCATSLVSFCFLLWPMATRSFTSCRC